MIVDFIRLPDLVRIQYVCKGLVDDTSYEAAKSKDSVGTSANIQSFKTVLRMVIDEPTYMVLLNVIVNCLKVVVMTGLVMIKSLTTLSTPI